MEDFEAKNLSQEYIQPETNFVGARDANQKKRTLRIVVWAFSIAQIVLWAFCFLWTSFCFSAPIASQGASQAGWVLLLPVVFVLFPLALATVPMAIVLLATAKGNEKDKRAGIAGLLIGLIPGFLLIAFFAFAFFVMASYSPSSPQIY